MSKDDILGMVSAAAFAFVPRFIDIFSVTPVKIDLSIIVDGTLISILGGVSVNIILHIFKRAYRKWKSG